jgi:hypothetical protein
MNNQKKLKVDKTSNGYEAISDNISSPQLEALDKCQISHF